MEDEIMVINLSNSQPQGPKSSETFENKTVDGTQNNVRINRGNTAGRPASPILGDFYYNTELNSFEVYNNGWFSVNTPPGVPTNVIATNQPSGRSYNNGQASVAFTPATYGGLTATSYTVTSNPGLYFATGSSSPIVVTGLQSSTQYVYTVSANNQIASSVSSSASSPVTATTVPQAPIIGTATPGSSQAEVTFTPGATGGSAITSYTVTSNPGNITASGSSSPIIVTGLTNGTSYTFTVTATNSNGTSSSSSSSNSASPFKMVGVEYLIVAGGGGSGGGGSTGYHSGGGGAGGLRSGSTQILLSTNYQISIGSGGTAGTQSGDSGFVGGNGTNSTALGLTAIGGGGGGGNATQLSGVGGKGAAGGSGGGGALYAVSPTGSGAGTAGQGNDGGFGSNSASGGGGGSGGIGGNASGGTGGNAGAGTVSSITGSSVNYAGGGAGRGGSQGGTSNGGTPVNTNGSSNTGNGGGGILAESGRAGGSGVVILKYLTSDGTITIGAGLSGSTATSGLYKITTITSGVGNVSWAS
jgi:hypothetical protein